MSATRQHIETERMTRHADVRAASLDKDTRTVEVVISTGALVRRRGWVSEWDEALPVDRARLSRINSIGVVLDNHRARGSVADTLGAVVPGSVRLDGGQLVGKLRFARGEAADKVLGLIEDGILRTVSVGYDVDEYEETLAKDRQDGGKRSLLTPTSWEPYEVSVVQMPADAGAVMRSDDTTQTRRIAVRSAEETTTMPEPEPTKQPAIDEQKIRAEERKRFNARLARFEAIGTSHGIDTAKVRALVEANDDDGAVGLAILELTAKRQENNAITGAQPPAGTRFELGREAADKMSDALGIALAHRGLGSAPPDKVRAYEAKMRADGRASEITPALDETTRELKRMRLIDLAKQFLESRGLRTGGWSHGQVAEAALAYRSNGAMMTTADFSGLLANTANKLLSVGYADVTSGWRTWGIARELNRDDFKQFTMHRRAGAPGLARINEHGEIKRSGWPDASGLTGQLKTAGVEVAFTRQMLINDDLDAFAQQNLGLGDSAVRFEDDYVMSTILYGNPTLSDSVALFHSSRGNLSTDVGTPDIAAITTAGRMFAAMTETIKDPANNNGTTTRKVSVQLRGFICALAEAVVFSQILGPRNPDSPSNAVADKFKSLVIHEDARLQVEASAPDAYFAFSNRTALVYGGLEGEPGPRLSMQVTTGVDGLIWQAIRDWYCDVEDPQAIIRIPKS